MASNCKVVVNDKNIRSYLQDMRKWSAELINHPITHQRLIDYGFRVMYPQLAPRYGVDDAVGYQKGIIDIWYDSSEGFLLFPPDGFTKECSITHESQLRHFYLMFTGFELNKL